MCKIIRGTLVLMTLIAVKVDVEAQDLVPADTLSGWDVNWVAGLNASQSTYSNWSRGGVNTYSVVGHSELSGLYRRDLFTYGCSPESRTWGYEKRTTCYPSGIVF